MGNFDLIGACSIDINDPFNKSYIVGASEEANERFREELKNVSFRKRAGLCVTRIFK